jgi:uncharacterized protein (UPF0548 family)
MKLTSQRQGREAPFDCDEWSELAVNATRSEVAQGFVHDTYESPFVGDFERAAEALLAYRIFPSSRMRAHVCTPDCVVAIGATIVQRVMLGPVSLESAVRVIEVERTPDRAALAYATLHGHAERGIASFAVTRTATGGTFEAQAWSRAGHWSTIIGRPVSRFLQRKFTLEAVASFCAPRT